MVTSQVDWWMLGAFVLGIAVFLTAGTLSTSIGFRVTSGGVLFSIGSIVIVMFVLMRWGPGERGPGGEGL